MTTTCYYCLEQTDSTTARKLGEHNLVCERCAALLDAYLYDTPQPLDRKTSDDMAMLAYLTLFAIVVVGGVGVIVAVAMLILPRLG